MPENIKSRFLVGEIGSIYWMRFEGEVMACIARNIESSFHIMPAGLARFIFPSSFLLNQEEVEGQMNEFDTVQEAVDFFEKSLAEYAERLNATLVASLVEPERLNVTLEEPVSGYASAIVAPKSSNSLFY